MEDDTNISVKSLLCPSFYELHRDIRQGKHTHYFCKGGRGSTKSSFISLEIVLGMMKDKQAHAAIYRKFATDLRDSVYNQLVWAINALGVEEVWSQHLSPLSLVYLPTRQRIMFYGLDTPLKSKSKKMTFGYFKYAWFEELEQFDGMREIRSVTQSLMRGGPSFFYFYSFNPPQVQSNWVNNECAKIVDSRLVHHSDYLTVPREWLGETFFLEAESLKLTDETAYKHEYLGEVTGTGGAIFRNLTGRTISDDEITDFYSIRNGLDWGFAVDPLAFVRCAYDRKKQTLYIFDEIVEIGLSNDRAAEKVRQKLKHAREQIIADSAEPKSIADLKAHGLNVTGAIKGKDSPAYGVKWLQRQAIIIDPKRCPNAFNEFALYEYRRDRNGGFLSDYPDKDNHTIDAVRYALESDMEGTRSGSSSIF